jgi:anti-sigma factor ChrR (cupin superfamily)
MRNSVFSAADRNGLFDATKIIGTQHIGAASFENIVAIFRQRCEQTARRLQRIVRTPMKNKSSTVDAVLAQHKIPALIWHLRQGVKSVV